MTFISGHVPDLRFGHVPLPDPAPGYDPAGDATALVAPGLPSPAREAIAGTQFYGSLGEGHRYVVRIPDAWNGDLASPNCICERGPRPEEIGDPGQRVR